MNKRIRELAEQAGYSKDFLAVGLPNNMEKFAELIVGECIGMIETEASQYSEPTWAVELVNDIKERFGVK